MTDRELIDFLIFIIIFLVSFIMCIGVKVINFYISNKQVAH